VGIVASIVFAAVHGPALLMKCDPLILAEAELMSGATSSASESVARFHLESVTVGAGRAGELPYAPITSHLLGRWPLCFCSRPKSELATFVYRCPNTGLNVQGWLADDPTKRGGAASILRRLKPMPNGHAAADQVKRRSGGPGPRKIGRDNGRLSEVTRCLR
jgi:hypothetical protein